MFFVLSFSCLCTICWSQVLSREYYIWVISNLIAYLGMTYIRDLMVLVSSYLYICLSQTLGDPQRPCWANGLSCRGDASWAWKLSCGDCLSSGEGEKRASEGRGGGLGSLIWPSLLRRQSGVQATQTASNLPWLHILVYQTACSPETKKSASPATAASSWAGTLRKWDYVNG